MGFVYASAKDKFGSPGTLGITQSGSIRWLDDTIIAVLVDEADYTPDQASHEFLSDIPVAARVAISAALTGKTLNGGVFDADDTVFSNAAGDTSEAVALVKDTGDPATSPLIIYADGITVTPNGNNLNLVWSNAAGRIFSL